MEDYQVNEPRPLESPILSAFSGISQPTTEIFTDPAPVLCSPSTPPPAYCVIQRAPIMATVHTEEKQPQSADAVEAQKLGHFQTELFLDEEGRAE